MSFSKLFFVAIICSFFFATPVLAYRKADFPDSKSLQPIPQGVAPNISGNVNTLGKTNQSPVDGQENVNPSSASPNAPITKASSLVSSDYIWVIVFCALIIFFGVFIWHSARTKKSD